MNSPWPDEVKLRQESRGIARINQCRIQWLSRRSWLMPDGEDALPAWTLQDEAYLRKLVEDET